LSFEKYLKITTFASDLQLRENGRFRVLDRLNQCRGAISMGVFLMCTLWQSISTLTSFARIVGISFYCPLKHT